MPQPHSLTVVTVAKNEARNMAHRVRSGPFADDVLVLERPDRRLPFGRRDKAGTDHFLHTHMTVDGSVADLHSPSIHFSQPDLHDLREQLDRHPSGHVRGMFVRENRGRLGKALLHGWMAFVRTCFLRLGFLDGQRGLMLAVYNAEHAHCQYVKPMCLQSPPQRPEFPG